MLGNSPTAEVTTEQFPAITTECTDLHRPLLHCCCSGVALPCFKDSVRNQQNSHSLFLFPPPPDIQYLSDSRTGKTHKLEVLIRTMTDYAISSEGAAKNRDGSETLLQNRLVYFEKIRVHWLFVLFFITISKDTSVLCLPARCVNTMPCSAAVRRCAAGQRTPRRSHN